MPAACTTPAGLCGATLVVLWLVGWGYFCPSWPCLSLGRLSPCGSGTWFQGRGGAWPVTLPSSVPPALPPVSSAHWPLSAWSPLTPGTHTLFPPRCSSLPAPRLEIPKTLLSPPVEFCSSVSGVEPGVGGPFLPFILVLFLSSVPSSDHDDRWETKEAVSAARAPQPALPKEAPVQVGAGLSAPGRQHGVGCLGPCSLSLTCLVFLTAA